MIKESEVFRIGRITRTHGIHGEVELQFTDDAFDRGEANYLVLLIDGIFVPFFFEEYRFKSNEALLICFADVTSEDAARRLVGLQVFYPHAALPADDVPSMRSVQAFVGFTLLLADLQAPGETADDGNTLIATNELGRVEAVQTLGASTLFVVRTTDNDEILIPFHEDFLLNADLHHRQLLLQLPEGLLELNA